MSDNTLFLVVTALPGAPGLEDWLVEVYRRTELGRGVFENSNGNWNGKRRRRRKGRGGLGGEGGAM